MIHSIRTRAVILALLAQLLAVACAVGITVWYVHRAVWASVDSELHARMISLLAQVGEADENPNRLTFDGDQAKVQAGDLFYIEDPQHNRIAGSAALLQRLQITRVQAGKPWRFVDHEVRFRARALMGVPILDQENPSLPQLRVNLFYAMPVNRTEAQIANSTRMAAAIGLLSLLLSAGFTWWAVGRGMRPLLSFARQADRMQAHRAQFTLPADAVRSPELIPLARALEGLAQRVRAAFDRERRFLSDAAHELKTTVAIQKSTLQLLEQGSASLQEYREGIARALEDSARTERLVADMLLLSSIEHALPYPAQSESERPLASLSESLHDALDRLAPFARMKSIALELDAQSEATVQGRQSDLSLLWINLIENAIQHSPQGSIVKVDARQAAEQRWRIRVSDSGTGIAPADLPHVFERFYRSDRSRARTTGGFGLGLSIAKAIVDNLGGVIAIESHPGSGTVVEVELAGLSSAAQRIAGPPS